MAVDEEIDSLRRQDRLVTIAVGQVWVEKARRGRRVIIEEALPALPRAMNRSRREASVVFRTITVHNKRAQRHPTISDLPNFVKRFERVS